MVEVALLRRPLARVLGRVPRVEVRVEVQHAQRPAIYFLERAQCRQRQGVVPAERDEPRLGQEGRDGGPGAELGEGRAHLRQRLGVVERRHRDVAAVEDLGPVQVRVYARAGVEAAERRLACRGGADRPGAETGSCTSSGVTVSR